MQETLVTVIITITAALTLRHYYRHITGKHRKCDNCPHSHNPGSHCTCHDKH